MKSTINGLPDFATDTVWYPSYHIIISSGKERVNEKYSRTEYSPSTAAGERIIAAPQSPNATP